ncbi:MAG: arginine--tRNA ligase [Pseudomonadota bacterium]
MNLFAEFRAVVLTALETLVSDGVLPDGLDFTNVTVEPPRDAAHGDLATNAAMVLAKPAKAKPRDIAEALAPLLGQDARVTAAEVAGPGFINLRLANGVWRNLIQGALASGADWGRGDGGGGRKVNVEFVSANPTGPLHVGHTRGAVFGDALAGLLSFAGWEVTREYYINDGGAQVDVLARSAYHRYREAHGENVVIPDGLYPGDYLVPIGEALKAEYGDAFLNAAEEEWLPIVRPFATDRMMDLIRGDLAALGVHMDVYYSEKSLYGTGRIEGAIEALREKGLIYEGVLEPPKGRKPDDWEPREQTLFRSTEHGDDVDRPVMKSDGSWTYFAPDIAYHFDKVERGFDLLIDVLGADHGGYVKRLKAVVAALSDKRVDLDVKLCQLVKLFKNGAEFKMSKRAGTFVTLRDVLDEVGPDVTRFMLLTRKNDQGFDFDLDKALEQSKDNPVFYVQYAHARIASMLRTAAADYGAPSVEDPALAALDLSALDHPEQIVLAKKVGEWPRVVEGAAQSAEPHRVAFYLYDLAAELHAHYTKAREAPELKFLQGAAEGDLPRLALARAVGLTIANGLAILGVSPAQEMR